MPNSTPAGASARDPDLDFDERGQPFSPRYGDVYRSRAGALAEARDVFLAGCGLPAAWRGRDRYAILELGFGLGVNFLATLRAWREDPARPARLDYVAVELHPLESRALVRAHEALGVAGDDAALLARSLPPPLPGAHRVAFESGSVALTLVHADAAHAARNLDVAIDAFFLDGFAPPRNPRMWEPGLMRALARLARPGAAAATYSAAGAVRRALADAGFDVRVEPGHGAKRHRLAARYAPRWRTFPFPAQPPAWPERTALVVGGGIAGSACARALALRGWQVRLVERRRHPMSEGSSQPALADHVHVSPDDNRLARLSRAALLLARAPDAADRSWRGAEPLARGALQLADGDAELERWRAAVANLGLAPVFAQALDAGAASDAAGVALPAGGLWLPACQAVDPVALGQRWLADAGGDVTVTTGVEVAVLAREAGAWRAIDAAGRTIDSAAVVVLANAGDAARLAPMASTSLRRVRGQSTLLDAPRFAALRAVLSGDAYACPLGAGRVLVGSTFDEGDSLESDPEADVSNVRRLARVTGAPAEELAPRARPGCTGFRWAARDHLPLVGAMPDEAEAAARAGELARNARLAIPRAPGLYGAFAFGSRGLLWSALAAEVLAARVEGAAPPLERDLLESIDPARFLSRSLRARPRRSGR